MPTADRTPVPGTRRRLRLGALLALVTVGGLVAHGWTWYASRAHALDVGRSRLLPPSPAAEAALWVPFPHQNLGALEAAIGDPDAVIAASGRLLGESAVAVPRLGAFGVPAAREAAIEWRRGEPPVLRAAVYPLWRWAARAAGTLAGNPWLAGGAVGGEGEERTVRWSDGVWELAGPTESAAEESDGPPVPSRGSVWARYEERRRGRALPPGTYDLTTADAGWRFTPAGRAFDPPGMAPEVVLLVVDLRAGAARALALTEGGEVRIGTTTVPGLGAVAPTAREAIETLPAGRWLDGLLELPASERDGRSAVATDAATLATVQDATATWVGWMGEEGLVTVAWLRPGAAARLADSVSELLEDLPLVNRETRARWRDATTVLQAAGGVKTVLIAG